MRIGVIGINHKLADLKLRERLAKTCQRRFGAEQSTHGRHAIVLLSTCNRTEIYFSSEDLAESHTYILNILRHDVKCDFDQKLYSYFHKDCFLHLARVTTGLDSAIVAETEIQGQVKVAYEKACEYMFLPGELHYLFQKCLHVGKQIRSELPLERGVPDLEHAILSAGRQFFANPEKAKILIVGASNINLKIIHYLKNRGVKNITLCNRTNHTALELAQKYQLKTLNWERLSHWHAFDWIIFGTKSSEYLIVSDNVSAGFDKDKLIIDLCVPRNVDPKLNDLDSITVVNIDQINDTLRVRKQRMAQFLDSAETFIENCAKRQMEIFNNRNATHLALRIAQTA